jgi:fructose-bisphosphate aldolase, class II
MVMQDNHMVTVDGNEEAIGIPEEQLQQAAPKAVCKIDIDSGGRLAITAAIRKIFTEKPEEFDPRKYLGSAREALVAMVKYKNEQVLGSAGKA